MSVRTRWPAFALDHASRRTPSSSSRSTKAALAADSIHTTFEASASSSGLLASAGTAPGAAAGLAGLLRGAAMNCARLSPVSCRASASSSAVARRGVRLIPRSRSLTVRGLTPAAAASSSWVSPASVRSCRSNPAYSIAGCSDMVGIPSRTFASPSPGTQVIDARLAPLSVPENVYPTFAPESCVCA